MFFQQIKNIFSNYYVNINAPVFMREVDKYSINDASLLVLICLYSIFLISLLIVYRIFFQQKLEVSIETFSKIQNSKTFAKVFIYLTFVIVCILIIHIISYNTPLFHHNINKNNYWIDYALIPQIKILSSQLNTLLFILGYLYTKQSFSNIEYTNKSFYFVILFLSIFYYILMKQKFGGPLLMLFSFFLPYLLLGIKLKQINFIQLFKILTTSVILLSIFVYGYFYMRFGNKAGSMILERVFSLQSEIWEVTYTYLSHNHLPINNNEFIKELSILFGFNNGLTGMQYVMKQVMGNDYFNFFMDIHINLSSAYPSYLFYIIPQSSLTIPIALFINFILYSIYAFLGFKVMEKLLNNKIIVAALYLKLFFAFENVITQVYLNSIISFKILLFILLIYLIENNFFNEQKVNL